VGKTAGVAPEADLYFIGCNVTSDPTFQTPGSDFTGYAQAVNRILDINKGLPEGRKIRVISLSVGWEPSQTGYQEITQAVERARREGVFVISSSLERTHGLRFHGLTREPLADPDSPASYGRVQGWGPGAGTPLLFVPMNSRATAAPTGDGDYAFYPVGGWSWVTPYLAGLYALACQAKPDVTPEEFWRVALETGDPAPAAPPVPVSREEIRKQEAARAEERLAPVRAKLSADEFRRRVRQIYEHETGKPAPEAMGEKEFQEWLVEMATDLQMSRYEPPSGRIPNPVRLVAALQK
jgi:hypothetical protein